MKKIQFVVLTVLSICFFSCGNKSEKDAQVDSLETALSQRDVDYKQLDEFLTVISESLDSIAMQESEIFNPNQEGPKPTQAKIKEDLEHFKQTLKDQRERITQLEKQLAGSQGNGKKLQRIIISLKAQLDEKESQITELQKELNSKNVTIEEMGHRIGALARQTTEQQEVITSQNKMMQTQDDELNTGYYMITTKSALKKANMWKSHKVDVTNLDKSLFKEIDIRVVTEIPINSKNATLLTQMPSDSYTIEKDAKTKTCTLRIIDPNRFWSVSKFLIIRTD